MKQTQAITKVALLALLLVFVLLRQRWVGHLLVWDEAMTLNTLRTLVAGGTDPFGAWFWRHPPLVTGLMALLSPLADGFAERVEWMAIGFNTAAAVVLWLVNRKVFGHRIALLSVGFYAAFPGAIVFDTWCKGDPGVAVFGLLALLFVVQRRDALAGLFLALAFMSKELAVFYALGLGLLLLFVEGGLPVRRLIKVFFPSVIALGAWYGFLMLRPRTGLKMSLLDHFRFAVKGDPLWLESPFYYFQQLPLYLGIAGLVMAVAGVLLLITRAARCLLNKPSIASEQLEKEGVPERHDMTGYWPVFLLFPTYVLLSVFPSKVAWLTMSLFPAWATLCALGLNGAISWLSRRSRAATENRQAWVASGMLGACMLGIAYPVLRSSYEDLLERVDPGRIGAKYSFEIAQAVNANVAKDERLLFTSFHYVRGIPAGLPCAVFTYYLRKDIPVLVRRHDAKIDQLLQDAARYEIDWLLLSPEPGDEALSQFGTLVNEHGLMPLKLEKAWLFRLKPESGKQKADAGKALGSPKN